MNNDTLQAMLSEQMDLLRNNKVDPKHVNAMVNAAGKILSSVKLELEYARMCGLQPNIPFIRQRGAAVLKKIALPPAAVEKKATVTSLKKAKKAA